MRITKCFPLLLLLTGFIQITWAAEPFTSPLKKKTVNNELQNDCTASISQVNLDINNVRARLLGGGDMWWDLSDGKYIIPAVAPGEPEVSSVFAGALWIGGLDAGGNLKLAAQTYRQTGNDFWTGPIDDENGGTDFLTCLSWDEHFKVNRTAIQALINDYLADDDGDGQPDYSVDNTPDESLLEWPGRGNPHFEDNLGFALPNQELAPFHDENGDGIYDPYDGDVPTLDLRGCDTPLHPDQMIWWVYNDVGNEHSDSQGAQIGMEIQAMAFAYATGDDVNNMTFYNYKFLNKSPETLYDTYIGQWMDADLGCWNNDHLGCQPDKDLGIVYNGTETDPNCASGGGLVYGYGEEVPMLGVDFLSSPTDENGNEVGMKAFVRYFSDFGPTSYPETAAHYYAYMTGFWKDGSAIEYGGDGYLENSYPYPYIFPSDPTDNSPDAWSECSMGNVAADRRFIQSTGSFTLEPGETNEMTVGLVWVPDVPHPCPSFDRILEADSLAQHLFDNCFNLLAVATEDIAQANSKLDNIQVFPNPGYTSDIQKINIRNLPPKSIVSIYSLDGRLIRQLNNATEISNNIEEWDMKNQQGQVVPASVYIIHIDATISGWGTKAIKWIGGGS